MPFHVSSSVFLECASQSELSSMRNDMTYMLGLIELELQNEHKTSFCDPHEKIAHKFSRIMGHVLQLPQELPQYWMFVKKLRNDYTAGLEEIDDWLKLC